MAHIRHESKIHHVLKVLNDPLLGDSHWVCDCYWWKRRKVSVQDNLVRIVFFCINGVFNRRENLKGKLIVPDFSARAYDFKHCAEIVICSVYGKDSIAISVNSGNFWKILRFSERDRAVKKQVDRVCSGAPAFCWGRNYARNAPRTDGRTPSPFRLSRMETLSFSWSQLIRM